MEWFDWLKIGLYLIVTILMLGLILAGPVIESSSYNRLCGGHSTYLDAIFADLRVDGSCKGGH